MKMMNKKIKLYFKNRRIKKAKKMLNIIRKTNFTNIAINALVNIPTINKVIHGETYYGDFIVEIHFKNGNIKSFYNTNWRNCIKHAVKHVIKQII
jgi:hypothetical protein